MLARKTILIRTPATAYLQARRSQARTSKSAPLRRRGQIRLTEIRYNSVENGPSGHDRKAASRRSSPRLDPRSRWMPKRSEEHTSELPSLMRITYAVLRLKKKNKHNSQ